MPSLFDMGQAGNPVGSYTYTPAATSSTAPSSSGSATGSPAPNPADPYAGIAGLTGDQRNAFEATSALLSQYGLGSLAKNLLDYAQQGFDSQTAYYLVQQTPEWKQRFAGNEALKKQGLAPLEPAAYLDLESRYASVLKQFGIPQGMYGQADFAQWIGNSVSPTEIQSRVQMAADNASNTDPYTMQSLAALGVDTGHMTAYYLDQSRALPFLQRQEQASQIGAEALRNHLNLDPNTAMQLASIGVTQKEAQSGYSQVAQELPTMQKLAQITPGASFGQSDAEQQVLFGNADAIRKAFGLSNTEEARFSGSPGVGTNIYHPGYGLSQPLQGQY